MAALTEIIDGDMSRKELQEALGLKDRFHFREAYLVAALSEGLIEMTIPDKPTSRLQKYRLSKKGFQKRSSHLSGQFQLSSMAWHHYRSGSKPGR